jgi:MFS family permease
MDRERLWTKNFIILNVINFFLMLVFYLLMVTIASYAVDKFHASTNIAGLAAGIFIIGILIGRLTTGRIIEDIGSKRILIIGGMLLVITAALFFGATSLPLIIVNRFLNGFAFGITSTAIGTIVAKIIPHNRLGEGIGYFSISMTFATAIGPLIGIYLLKLGNFNIIFLFTLVLTAICIGISFIISSPTVKLPQQEQVKSGRNFKTSNYLEFKVVPIALVSLIIGFSFSGVLSFLSLYARQINLVEAAGFYFLVFGITIIISRPFSGRLLDIKGANIVVYPCLFIFAMGMLLFSQANQGITLLLAAALTGLGYGNYNSVAQAIAVKKIPPNRIGLATATFGIFFESGLGIGPYIQGFLVPFSGYRGLYLIVVFVILADIVLYYFLHGRKAAAK